MKIVCYVRPLHKALNGDCVVNNIGMKPWEPTMHENNIMSKLSAVQPENHRITSVHQRHDQIAKTII